jgi:sialic acid synthase SpsE
MRDILPDHKFAMNSTTSDMVDNANMLYAAMGDGCIKRVEDNEIGNSVDMLPACKLKILVVGTCSNMNT